MKSKTAQAILKAATRVFAENGFEGARMDEIARQAGVNKATIYYHIGDKKALYTSVLRNVFGDTAERIARNLNEAETPQEKLRTYVRNLALTLERYPEMAAIMIRENISGGRSFPQEVYQDMFKIVAMLTGIFEQGRQEGKFVETMPFVVHLMVIGAMGLFKLAAPIHTKGLLQSILNIPEEAMNDMVAAEIEKLVLRAVTTGER